MRGRRSVATLAAGNLQTTLLTDIASWKLLSVAVLIRPTAPW